MAREELWLRIRDLRCLCLLPGLGEHPGLDCVENALAGQIRRVY